jgi:hypothetical protein
MYMENTGGGSETSAVCVKEVDPRELFPWPLFARRGECATEGIEF